MEQRILVVDDDRQVTSFLDRFFTRHGYQTSVASTAREMYAAVRVQSYDLIVLDLILPDADGFEAAKRIRTEVETPLIMLTARDDMYDRIVGLELGADDYVTKPYEPRELLARARSVMRRYSAGPRTAAPTSDVLGFDCFEIDLNRSVLRNADTDTTLSLTSTEFAMLRALAEAGGEVMTREEILALVYGHAVQITDRAIDAHIVRLRKKLSAAASRDDLIRTIHGVGYKLAARITPR